MANRFTFLILIAMFLGLALGGVANAILPASAGQSLAATLGLVTDVFLRLIKMIIAPLVLSTLITGVAHMGDAKAIGRVGGKAIGWFLAASLVSLLIGMIMVELLRPGAGLALPPPSGGGSAVQSELSAAEFLKHVVPASIFDAMAKNEILQIVVFSLFAGVAMAALKERVAALTAGIEQLSQLMLKITDYVMKFAPLAVFAAVASTVATQGVRVIFTFATFVGGFYLSLALLWLALYGASRVVLGGRRSGRLFSLIRAPTLLAFSTASSEAAYPRTLEQLERFGVSNRVASFVLPLGYSFNLDGSMMYCTFASLFIAQAYGVHLTFGQRITMLLLLMVTSKGIAGVPRASLVVIAATLPYFHIPEAGLVLILGVDHFLDMGRSATNVIGNSVASSVVAKWEGELRPEDEDALAPA